MFNPTAHRLPCLAHVINLAITTVMAHLTKIAAIEMITAIWEFNPSLPNNRVLGNSLDVVATIRTLAIKVSDHVQRYPTYTKLNKIYVDSVHGTTYRILRDPSGEMRYRLCSLHPATQ